MFKKIFSLVFIFTFVFNFFVSQYSYAESEPLNLQNIFIRSGEYIIYDNSFNFPEEGNVSILDSENNIHEVNKRSALGILYLLDMANDDFYISNLTYYASFNSFYLKCLNYQGTEYCDNWQFVVSGVSPFTSIDQTILNASQTLAFYFGNNHRLALNKNEIYENDSILVKAENYNYIDNSWGALQGITISVFETNPLDPWNPIILEEKLVNGLGESEFILNKKGNYNFGIKEDYLYPQYEFSVKERTSSANSSYVIQNQNAILDTKEEIKNEKEFNIQKATEFLNKNLKNEKGEYLSSLYLDWVLIALSQTESDFNKNEIIDYLEQNESFGKFNLTDYERNALTILALGENPYNFGNKNYVAKILGEFDGEQFGDKNLINDDVFAILTLYFSGFNLNDIEIQKSLEFIKNKQNIDGSFENSIDLTSAVVLIFDLLDKELFKKEITNALVYINNNKKENNSYGDSVFSTAWVLNMQNALGEENIEIKKYIIENQNEDGGIFLSDVSLENRIWATSYILPIFLDKNWQNMFQRVEKQNIVLTRGEVLGEKTSEIEIKNNLFFGSRGEEVKKLQNILKGLGYFKASITGYFGSLTREAVRKYQENNPPLKIDGIIGPKTKESLGIIY